MDLFPVFKELAQKSESRIVLVVLDGVGGFP
jgi:2,3-bisphosphoglycerate-independent phosphoglycerate mutase